MPLFGGLQGLILRLSKNVFDMATAQQMRPKVLQSEQQKEFATVFTNTSITGKIGFFRIRLKVSEQQSLLFVKKLLAVGGELSFLQLLLPAPLRLFLIHIFSFWNCIFEKLVSRGGFR